MSDVLSATLVARETAKDAILSRVSEYIHNGWPTALAPEFHPYKSKEGEFSIE